jgi:hypothetical protein
MRTGFFVLFITSGLSAAATAAEDRWIEVKSPHFTVVSNDSESRARNVAWQFEQIRAAIHAGWPWARVEFDRPVTVVAAKDGPTMRLLLPAYWEKRQRDFQILSEFATSPDRHYITMRADLVANDTQGVNPYRASYWSYSMLALKAAFERELPLWFRIGLAEVLSNSIVRDNEIQFGRAIPAHVYAIRQGSRVKLSELIELDERSPYFTDGTTRGRFDAQCWGSDAFPVVRPARGSRRSCEPARQAPARWQVLRRCCS